MRTLITTVFILSFVAHHAVQSWAQRETEGSGFDVELMQASRMGDLPKIRELVARGVDVNATNDGRVTALWRSSPSRCASRAS